MTLINSAYRYLKLQTLRTVLGVRMVEFNYTGELVEASYYYSLYIIQNDGLIPTPTIISTLDLFLFDILNGMSRINSTAMNMEQDLEECRLFMRKK